MKKTNLKSFIIATLRRASLRWPAKNEALRMARVERGLYRCNNCKNLFKKQDVALDHIEPIVPTHGWDNWDGFINRLFCPPDGFQVLCKGACHLSKTMTENNIRKIKKKLTKDKK